MYFYRISNCDKGDNMYFYRISNCDKGDNMYVNRTGNSDKRAISTSKRSATLIKETICT